MDLDDRKGAEMKLIPAMSNQARVMIALLILAVLCLQPQRVDASCIDPGDPQAAFDRDDAVFTGQAVYISSANGVWMNAVTRSLMALGFHPADFQDRLFPGRRIVFEVDRSWKGVTTSSVTIRTGYNDWNSSSYPFEIGSYYLVYASHAHGDPNKDLLTSRCHRTIESPNNSEDIAYLNTLSTLNLSPYPAILRTIEGNLIVPILLLAGGMYILHYRKKAAAG
jgi:hypothetical protein